MTFHRQGTALTGDSLRDSDSTARHRGPSLSPTYTLSGPAAPQPLQDIAFFRRGSPKSVTGPHKSIEIFIEGAAMFEAFPPQGGFSCDRVAVGTSVTCRP